MSERMEDSEWLSQATGLRVGERRRGDHDCGAPGSLLLSRDEQGLRAYCFRCGKKGSKREQEDPLARIARLQREASADLRAQRNGVTLPGEAVRELSEWPQRDKLWLYKMGFSPRMIEELGMYWCPDLGRVVLPIMRDGHAVTWLARSSTRSPKWLLPSGVNAGTVAEYGLGKGDTIVLCEDALSAYKVGQVTEAWSLLGTKLHSSVAQALVTSGKRVAVWLDNDQGRRGHRNPGQEAARKIRALLSSYGVDVRNITSDRDPKYYNTSKITEALR